MPPKIKLVWVACILIVLFGFICFSFIGKAKEAQQKSEERIKQQSRITQKLNTNKAENKGRTFKVDPIKEIKELNAQGMYEDAVKYAEGVAMLNPNQPKIYTWWGISLVKSGKNEDAIKKFVKSVKLDNSYSKTYLYWGLTLAMNGKTEEAIDKYKRVIELDSSNSNAYGYWGAALLKLNQNIKAIEKFEHALEINPRNNNVTNMLIDSLVHLEKYKEAWQVVKKSRRINVVISEKTLKQLSEIFPEPAG